MTGEELILKLKIEGYIIEKGENDYIISNKLLRELPKQEPIKTSSSSQYTIEQFRADCKIPFRATTLTGVKYTLNGISDYARKAFNKIMLEGKYSYEDMVEATKKYYNDSSTARVILTNYFKQQIFECVMEEYLNKKESVHAAPSKNTGGRISL